MNGELKAKWLEALRSGRYKQGQGRLRDESNQFCCLGVLCDVGVPGQWDYSFFCGLDFGISRGYSDMIIMMNDTYRLSFKEMADWIEENIKED